MSTTPLVALSAAHLNELLGELAPLLVGHLVRAVEALPPRDLVLVLEPGPEGPRRLLRISASPDAPRLHLQRRRFERYEGPSGPFFKRLESELPGARLLALEQPAGDRLALLRFSNAQGQRRSLVAELVGRHANLCWLDGSERVLDLLVPAPPPRGSPGKQGSPGKPAAGPERPPRLVLGQPWVPPPGRAPSPAGAPDLATAFEARAPELDENGRGPDPSAPLSWIVEWSLGTQAEGLGRARETRDLGERLERRLARAVSTVKGLAQRRTAALGAERVLKDGELLRSALPRLKRGLQSIELEDWFEAGAPRTIELDPKLSPHENVERLFKRFHKLERSLADLDRESERAVLQVERLEALCAGLAGGREPSEIEAEAVKEGLLEPLVKERGKRSQTPAPRLPYRRFVGLKGGEILVGRTAKDNDALTFKVARGNDLWLHTADSPGSHVVLRVPKGAEPQAEDVLDACHLAAHFSPLAGATRINIHLAPRKQVHKPRGAPPGLVTLSGGKTRSVRIEPERLARLLDERRGAQPPS